MDGFLKALVHSQSYSPEIPSKHFLVKRMLTWTCSFEILIINWLWKKHNLRKWGKLSQVVKWAKNTGIQSVKSWTYFVAADLANWTTMGLSFKMKPFVSLRAAWACVTLCSVMNAWPFILPSCMSLTSNLQQNHH